MAAITGFSHVKLQVCDLEKALHFYVEGLGLTLSSREATSAVLTLPDGAFMELSAGGEPISNTSGITHICFDTHDCDATVARALQYGAVLSRGDCYDLGDLRIGFVTAPCGEEVEFWFIRHDGVSREAVHEHHYCKGFVHVALTVPDMPAVVAFYAALGVPLKTDWGWGCSLKLADARELELFTKGQYCRNMSGYTHFALNTADVPAAYALALSLGAESMQPPKTVGNTTFAFVYGLSGELLELFDRRP